MRHRARMPAVPTSAPSLARGLPSAGRISWPSDCRRPARASKSPVLERSQPRTRRARPRGRGRRGRASDHYAKKRRERTRRLVHLAAASRAGGLALALFGLLLRVLLAPEDDLAVLRVHEDRVALLEVDRATVPIGETPVVEDLQEDVEDVGVRLLDLVEQEHGVRPPPYCFGELSALLEPDVAGRRADEPRDRVLFHVLGHVQPDERLLVVEKKLRQRLGEQCLAHAGGAQEEE